MRKPVMHSIWLVLVLSVLSSSVRAGTLGDLTYEIADGEVTITECRRSAEGDLEVPAEIEGFPVTRIGNYAFRNCINLTSITIQEGVTRIGNHAFIYCSGLTSITIFEGVTTIGHGAFNNCINLSSITIPEGVTSIGNGAFQRCSSLTEITIPSGVTSIGKEAFAYCTSLTSVIIPDSVTSIGDSVFYECRRLTSITIPNGVTSIGDSAFYNCRRLTSIAIPDSVTSIGDWAFGLCFALELIIVPPTFLTRAEAERVGGDATRELWGTSVYTTHSNTTQPPTTPTIQPSIRMAPVIMVQGEEGSVKTIEVADSPDGPWRFWMDVTATASGVAITDLDGQAHKRFYRVRD